MEKRFLIISTMLSIAFLISLMLPLVHAWDYRDDDCVCDHNWYGEESDYDQFTATGLTGWSNDNEPNIWLHAKWQFQRGYDLDNPYGAATGPFSYWKIGSNTYDHYGGGSWYDDGDGNWVQDYIREQDVDSGYIAGEVISQFQIPESWPPTFWMIGWSWAELTR